MTSAFICGVGGLALTADERSFLRDVDPWGLILFKRNIETPAQILDLVASFRAAVGRADAPVLIDQEGGRVQRLADPFWPKYPPARTFGDLYDVDPLAGIAAARLVTRMIAEDLTALGITVDCLPVLDVPQPGSHDVIGNRAYHTRPETAALLARAAMEGLKAGGVLPIIKHIPGHGRANADSHHALPVVDTPAGELRAIDFLPFAALSDAPMAMTAHVVYRAIDPVLPATLSPTVMRVVREDIGYDGLVMTDDLSMKALNGTLRDLARQSLEAGCDMLLHCNGNLDEMAEVAAGAGTLHGSAARRAARALASRQAPAPLPETEKARALAFLTAVAAA
ncbi:MAG: beta-N-acetylhexosaminidase [Hyphomicrobiales bacterium]